MRRRTASAVAFLLICACKAEDQVLTPDEEHGGRDAGVAVDASVGPVITGDGGGTMDASNGADAALSNDAAPNGADAALSNDAGGSDGGGGPVTHTAKDPDCDLNGLWIARQNTESLPFGLPFPQYANNWYYLEFAQDGEQVVVSKHMDCGIEVQGALRSALVLIGTNTTRALISHNRQVGRKGSFSKQSDGTCAFQMEKFWSVRGLSEETYAPKPRSRDATIAQMQTENPLPSKAMADLAEDWDGDGQKGIAWEVSTLVNGTRHSVQRDWTRWFSANGYMVTAAADFASDLVVRADFGNEEIVYAISPEDASALEILSEPNGAADHALTLRFLGRTPEDPRAKALLKADDFETCMAIQKALPPLEGLK
jgi:hypothetical protein